MRLGIQKALLLVLAVLLLTGCVSKKVQLKGTWEFMGYKDGRVESIFEIDSTVCFDGDGNGFCYSNDNPANIESFTYIIAEDHQLVIIMNDQTSVVEYSIDGVGKRLTIDGLEYRLASTEVMITDEKIEDEDSNTHSTADTSSTPFLSPTPSPTSTPNPTSTPTPIQTTMPPKATKWTAWTTNSTPPDGCLDVQTRTLYRYQYIADYELFIDVPEGWQEEDPTSVWLPATDPQIGDHAIFDSTIVTEWNDETQQYEEVLYYEVEAYYCIRLEWTDWTEDSEWGDGLDIYSIESGTVYRYKVYDD